MSTESTTRQELAQVEGYLARLADNEGAHSQRAVGVR